MIKSAKIIHKISWRNAIGEYKTQGTRNILTNSKMASKTAFYCITIKNLLPS